MTKTPKPIPAVPAVPDQKIGTAIMAAHDLPGIVVVTGPGEFEPLVGSENPGDPIPAAAEPTIGNVLAKLGRRKMGRGSSRRIIRARDAFLDALTAFRKDMDFEVFEVDDEGVKVGPWPMLKDVDVFREGVTAAIEEILK